MLKIKKDVSLHKYRVFETNEFINCLEKLPKREKDQVEKKLLNYVYPQIKNEPHFGINIKKLYGYYPDTWRYRIGHYRIFYTIDETIVNIISIENRKDAYN